MLLLLIMMLALAISTKASLLNFLEVGALPNDLSDIAAWHNGRLLNETLALLQPGDLFDDDELMLVMMMAAWHNGRLFNDTLPMLNLASFRTVLFWLEIRKISKNYDDFCDVYNSLLMLLWFILFLALMLYSWLIYLLLLHIVDGNPTRWYFAAAQHDFPCDGGNICKRPEFCCFTGLQTIFLCFMPFFANSFESVIL